MTPIRNGRGQRLIITALVAVLRRRRRDRSCAGGRRRLGLGGGLDHIVTVSILVSTGSAAIEVRDRTAGRDENGTGTGRDAPPLQEHVAAAHPPGGDRRGG